MLERAHSFSNGSERNPAERSFTEICREYQRKGWRSAGDLGIYWGNVVRNRHTPAEFARELEDALSLTVSVSRQDGSSVRLYSPSALLLVGKKLMEHEPFARFRPQIEAEIASLTERYDLREEHDGRAD